jgi:hypothetical protein
MRWLTMSCLFGALILTDARLNGQDPAAADPAAAQATPVAVVRNSFDEIQKKIKMDELAVLGSVRDGDDARWVLCRIKMRFDDFSFQVLGCLSRAQG